MGRRRSEPAPNESHISIVAMHGTKAYRDWMDDVSRRTLISRAVIVRDALSLWARSRDLPEPPPK